MRSGQFLLFALFLFINACTMQAKITDLSSGASPVQLSLGDVYNDEAFFSLSGSQSSELFTVTLSTGQTSTGYGSNLYIDGLTQDTTYSAKVCFANQPDNCSQVSFKTLKTLSLNPVYSGSADWNTYVRNNGSTKYNATGVACDGTEVSNYFYKLCLHGAELKKATAPSLSGVSCSAVSITDKLEAFDWTCDASSGSATAFSVGLKSTKGLMDLVTESGYISNRILISQGGSRTHSTSKQNWWSNPIAPLPSGGTALSSAGTIYVLGSSRTDSVKNITADRISVVIKEGASLSSSEKIFDVTASQKYLWFEGSYTNGSTDGISLAGIKFSKFRKMTLKNFTAGAAVLLKWTSGFVPSEYIDFQNVKIDSVKSGISVINFPTYVSIFDAEIKNTNYVNNTSAALFFNGLNYLRINNLTSESSNVPIHGTVSGVSNAVISNSIILSGGIRLGTVTNSLFYNLQIGGYFVGIDCDNTLCQDNKYVNIFLPDQSLSRSIELDQSDVNNTFLNITALNSTDGLMGYNGGSNTFSKLFIPFASRGIYLYGGGGLTNYKFTNIFFSGTFQNDPTTSNVSFTDYLLTSSTLYCSVTSGGPNVGLANATCANTGTTTATRVTGLNATSSLVGTSTGQNNLYIANGYDMRPKLTDTVIRNTSGDGSSQNTAFVAGATCPNAVHGNRTVTDQMTTPNTFLINAFEIIDDSIGDDDGFCESNEACIYSPNYGAYQGEGDYSAAGTCTFQNGTVTGVQMYAYPVNGN